MKKIIKYQSDVDNVMWDLLGSQSFGEDHLDDIIDIVSKTIYQYNKNIKLQQLKSIVRFIIENKYNKVYIYDKDNEPNRVVNTKIVEDSSDESEMSDILGDIDLSKLIIGSEEKPKCGLYINSEIDMKKNLAKISDSISDLISHRHDYDGDVFTEKKYIRRQKRIVQIKKIPQHEQKSQAWLDQRKECITATGVATALDQDPYKHPGEFLLDKCDRGAPFIENENVHHGKKYEDIGSMFYSFRNNIEMKEYGLLQHEEYKFVGASPDGICEKNTYDGNGISKLVGRLLEIKFPLRRQILTTGELNGDICPRQYYLQCLTQMFVTKMDECDFLQCKMEEYESYEDFINDSDKKMPGLSKTTGLEKGCLIQLLPKNMIGTDDKKMCLYNAKYIYPPKLHMTIEETEKWISKEVIEFVNNKFYSEYVIDKILYWKFSKVTCHLVKADNEFIMESLPILEQFWKYVEFYREYPKKLDEIEQYMKMVGFDKTADIFEKINEDYLSVHKKSKFKPLYQEVNEWRKKFNEKNAKRRKYYNKG